MCAHPGLLAPEYLDDPDASGKFDAFIETVEEVLDVGVQVADAVSTGEAENRVPVRIEDADVFARHTIFLALV